MKNVILCLITILAVVLCTGSKEHAPDSKKADYNSEIVDDILAVHTKITEAAQSLDADKFYSYIANEDNVVIIQDGQVLLRQEALYRARERFARLQSVKYNFTRRNVRILSPEMALLSGEGTVDVVTTSGQSFTVKFANTSLFNLIDGKWQIIHGHYSTPTPQ